MKKTELEQILRETFSAEDRSMNALSDHDLLAMQSGRLSEAERERLIARNIGSESNIRALLHAACFPDSLPDSELVEAADDTELDAKWQRFETRLRQSAETARRPGVHWRKPWSSLVTAWQPIQVRYVVGALLVLVAALAAFLIGSKQLANREPVVNARLVELLPIAEQIDRRGLDTIDRSSISEGMILVLTLSDPTMSPFYELSIRDPKGALLWTSRALERSPDGFFVVFIPPNVVSVGRYRISIAVPSSLESRTIAEYELMIE